GISAIILFALSDARARACGVMRARSSENFLAIDKALFPQLLQMLVVKPVGNRNMDFIPAIAAGLVAANQQVGRAAWVKCIQGSQGTTIMLRPQFSHVAVPGTLDAARMGKVQRRAKLLKQLY